MKVFAFDVWQRDKKPKIGKISFVKRMDGMQDVSVEAGKQSEYNRNEILTRYVLSNT